MGNQTKHVSVTAFSAPRKVMQWALLFVNSFFRLYMRKQGKSQLTGSLFAVAQNLILSISTELSSR